VTGPGFDEDSEPAATPARIGRYRVSRSLGAGAFATVYLAWDDALDVPVAVKVLAQNWSFEPEVRRRFIQEAQLLRRVDGTRVVRVHDIGETEEGQPYFVMDYASHGTVEDRLIELAAAGEKLDSNDVLRFCRQLAAGVAEVHRLQVAHRDLKPSNLLLRVVDDPSGGSGIDVGTTLVHRNERVVVSDLGLAKDLLGPTRLTVAAGTPGYMAPEQHDPSARIDGRADLYACSAILQRVVTGAHPEPAGPEVDPAALDDLPPEAAELLMRGLSEDPEDRFGTAEEWLTAVEAAIDALAPLEAVPPEVGELVSGLSRLSGEGGTRGRPRSVGSAPRGGARAPVPAPPRSSPRRRILIAAAVVTLAVAAGAAALFLRSRGDTTGPTATADPTTTPSGSVPPATSSTTPSEVSEPGPTTQPPDLGAEPALESTLYDPISLAVGSDGSLAVAEQSANRVRLLSGDRLRALAGTGRFGSGGNTGPAVEAELSEPHGIDYGPDGSLYVVDTGNLVVRRITPDGRIDVVAGSGQAGTGGDGGPATSAQLSPTDVAALPDGGFLVADGDNGLVRWVSANGVIQTVLEPGSTGATEVVAPVAVDVSADGSFVVADFLGQRILRVSGVEDPVVEVVAGTGEPGDSGDGGPATTAQLAFPSDVALGGDGSVYVADRLNHRIRLIDGNGLISTVAGTGEGGLTGDGGPATEAQLWHPMSVAVGPDGSLFIADGFNNRIRVVTADGTIETVAGSGPRGEVGDGGPATAAPLGDPFGLAFDGDNLLVAENWTGRLRTIDPEGVIGTLVGSILGEGDLINPLVTPTGASVSSDGRIAVAESGLHRVTVIDGDSRQVVAGSGTSGFSGDGGPAELATLSAPLGVRWTADGDLLVADSGNHRVRRITFTDGGPVMETVAGTGEINPTPDGRAPLETAILFPYDVIEGPNGEIFISEGVGSRVRRITADGEVTTVLGTGVAGSSGDGGPGTSAQVDTPSGLALAPDGSLFVADLRGHRIRRLAPDGTVTTVAGTGAPGYSGDGGPGTEAQLNSPSFLVVNGNSLLIADTGNRRVRILDLGTGTIATAAGAF